VIQRKPVVAGKAGGVYIPPFRLAQMMREVSSRLCAGQDAGHMLLTLQWRSPWHACARPHSSKLSVWMVAMC
jgi:hypothetical protein